MVELEWAPARKLAWQFDKSLSTVTAWPRAKTFPKEALKRHGRLLLFHIPTVERWLRIRALYVNIRERRLGTIARGLPHNVVDARGTERGKRG